MSTIDNKYLVLRGKNKDIYFIQKRVSKAVSKIIGKDFIKKSLDTTDINVAREKRDKILQELDNIANKHALIDEFDDNTHDQTNFNDVNQKILSIKDNIFVPIEKKSNTTIMIDKATYATTERTNASTMRTFDLHRCDQRHANRGTQSITALAYIGAMTLRRRCTKCKRHLLLSNSVWGGREAKPPSPQ